MAPTQRKKGVRREISIAKIPAFTQKDGAVEDADAIFEAGQSPASSLDSPDARKKKKGTPKKPKKTVRYSLDTKGEDEADDLEITTSTPAINSTVKNMARSKNRESMDASDLSSVSTAPPVTMMDEVEEARQSDNIDEEEEEEEVAALQESENTPAADNQDDDDDGGFPVDNDMDDDDDLVPPSPPQNDDDQEEDPITQDDEAAAADSVPLPDEENATSPADDFPTNDYDDDDDDKEGTGFQMEDSESPDDPETPESVREQLRRKEERRKKLEMKKKDAASARSKDKKNKRKIVASMEESSEEEMAAKSKKHKPKKKKLNRFATTFSPKGVPGPRTFTNVPISEFKGDSPEEANVRRSKRAHCPPLEYWRGETYEYGANDFGDDYDGVKNMPVVVGVTKPNPTPYKKRKAPPAVPKKKAGKKKGKKGGDDDDDDKAAAAVAEEEPFDSSRIRAKYNYNDGKTAHLWDERYGETRGIKVVAYQSKMEARDLPLSKSRTRAEGKVVGKAAQSFHMTNEENPAYPGYIVGSLILPPRAIKDAESVGLCAQVFTVVKGQAGSIEIAFGDPDQEGAVWDPESAERFLLSVGDNFLVPPGNSYRIQNHSKATDALLSWTIIRHNQGLTT